MIRQAGFSLLELLLVLAASSLFLFSVYQLFFHQQQQYKEQQLLLSAQENMRLAVHLLKNNMQTAGEAGCGTIANLKIFDHVQHYPKAIYERDGKIYIEKAAYNRAHLLQTMNDTFEPLYIHQDNLFKENDIVLISDCEYADLFKIKKISSGELGQILYHDGLSRLYNSRAQVMHWQVDSFYVTPHQHDKTKFDLYQKTILPDKPSIELVEQLNHWQVQYGLLKHQQAVFLNADEITNWKDVRGVNINDFYIVLYNAK